MTSTQSERCRCTVTVFYLAIQICITKEKEDDKEFIIVQEDHLEEKQVEEEKYQAVARGMKAIKEDCRQLLMNYYFKKNK